MCLLPIWLHGNRLWENRSAKNQQYKQYDTMPAILANFKTKEYNTGDTVGARGIRLQEHSDRLLLLLWLCGFISKIYKTTEVDATVV